MMGQRARFPVDFVLLSTSVHGELQLQRQHVLSTEDTEGHGERQRQRQLPFSTKGREGPRRTATATLFVHGGHGGPRRTATATATSFFHEGPRRTGEETATANFVHGRTRMHRRTRQNGTRKLHFSEGREETQRQPNLVRGGHEGGDTWLSFAPRGRCGRLGGRERDWAGG